MLGLVLIAALAPQTQASDRGPARPAAQILRDFDGVEYPSFSDGSDPESIARFTKAIETAAGKQQSLALELLASHPGHARVVELMRQRWTLLCTVNHDGRKVLEETGRQLGDATPAGLRKAAAAARAMAALQTDLPIGEKQQLVVESWQAVPGDEGAASAIFQFVKYETADPKLQRELLALLDAPEAAKSEDGWIAKDAGRVRQLLDVVGQPLHRELTAAHDLNGKPAIVHFASPAGAAEHDRYAEHLQQYATRFAASGLQIVTVPESLEDWEKGPLRRIYGQAESPLLLLVDRTGAVVAFSFRVEPLGPELERLFAAPKRRPL